ncbi:MAG: hypothetical protein PSV24_16030 [Rhodoferax sp.]|nr:hypothetical protein [Rhodoferax sp.]
MLDFHKPDWLYEALPYVYVIGGVVTIVNFDSGWSNLSGGLLISAGAFIWWMRRSFRQNQVRGESDRRAADRRTADRKAADRNAANRRAADRKAAERRALERRESDRRNH